MRHQNNFSRLESYFQNFRQRRVLSSNTRSKLHIEYDKSISQLNEETKVQLES